MILEKIKKRVLYKDEIRKNVLTIALPVLIELLLGSLFGMLDMIMLGRIKDPVESAASVAAVGITNQPVFIVLSLVQALNTGGTAMVARYVGANTTGSKIENTVKHVILLNMILLTLPFTILGFFFAEKIMVLMGAESDAVFYGVSYFRIIMIGLIFQSFNFSLTAALRGAGDTKLPMKVNLRANFLNVIGNAILIYGLFGFPRLGIKGAAISTSFSHVIATIMMCYHILRGKSIIKLNLKTRFHFSKDIMFNLVKIGVPASLEQMAMRIGILLYVRLVATLGTVLFAAHQISLSIFSLSFQPAQAFGIAASSLVGQSLGAKDLSKAEKYAKESQLLGSIVATFMALIFFIFGPQLAGLYNTNPEIIKNAAIALKIIALVQPFQSSQLVLVGGLRGAGDTFWPLISTFFGIIVVRVVLAFIFVIKLGLGLPGAWIAVFIDQIVRWAFIYFRFKSGKWKYIKLR